MLDLDFAKLEAAAVSTDPFPHIVVHDISRNYDQVLKVSRSQDYVPYAHPDSTYGDVSTRLRARASFSAAQTPWPRFRNTLFELFGLKGTPSRTALWWHKDLKGYKILPHPDKPDKLITAIFYLPDDDSLANTGTALLRRQPRYDQDPIRDTFAVVKQVPFEPNTLFAFKRSDESWHSVQEVEAYEPRYSFTVICSTPKRS